MSQKRLADSRLHGPAKCSTACSECDGEHHWMEDGPSDDAPHEACTGFGLTAWYTCKHCETWAECEYVWALGEGEAISREEANRLLMAAEDLLMRWVEATSPRSSECRCRACAALRESAIMLFTEIDDLRRANWDDDETTEKPSE